MIKTIKRVFTSIDVESVPDEKVSKVDKIVEKVSEYPLERPHMHDLYNAVRYTLFHEVTTHKILNTTQIIILKRFVEVLDNYFPFRDHYGKTFIGNLFNWLNNQEYQIDIKMYTAFIAAGSFPEFKPYISCRASEDGFREYPCSLWLLFHVLTVNEFLIEDHLPDGYVLNMMRDYIINFFSCKYCAEHFFQMSKTLKGQLRPGTSIIWLWSAHNKVNQRLKDDETQDPMHPKIQFPSLTMCPLCFERRNKYNINAVFEFMIDHYSNVID